MTKTRGFLLIALIILADQLSKWAVLEYLLKDGASRGFIDWLTGPATRLPYTSIEVLPFFNLTMVWNDGVSFGLLDGLGPWPLTIAALAISAVFVLWMVRASALPPFIASTMIVGGALGNVVDRFRFGAVADFLDFHAYGWHYPAFNLADSCITLGIALLLIDSLFLESRRGKG